MIALSPSKVAPTHANPSTSTSSPSPKHPSASFFSNPLKSPRCSRLYVCSRRLRALTVTFSKSSPEEAELSAPEEDEWLKRLPDKTKPLYSHSLPCIEAWLRNLGFFQGKEDRAVWSIELPEWHAQLSLDVTDLYIRYLKSGPGNLEKDVERRFSYALSREDIENAILGGP
ncbi:uncharacterized protein LOC115744522 [Rhodamnia argentea]|uniref:Uncharacterized protein LOC115744522 n=1 Tax=Rhodamnia argentea TaxID=178133 RepID=A0A8B8PMK8_9MYRT|nr:uncharacterized protein LOC115744522 [Rhodamnia argentea]